MSDDIVYLTQKQRDILRQLQVNAGVKAAAAKRRYELSLKAIDREFQKGLERHGLAKAVMGDKS